MNWTPGAVMGPYPGDGGTMVARDIGQKERMSYAMKGWALEDGSYPIPDREHLKSAIVLAQSGHGDVAAAKRLIKKRARELGAENELPKDW